MHRTSRKARAVCSWRVATARHSFKRAQSRYEKTARAFLDVLCMAATMDWLKVIKN